MALTTLMSWQPDKSRWRKTCKGVQYFVTCSALGCDPTKEASASAANAWWRSKQIELAASHPHASHLKELERRLSWSESHGETIEANNLKAEITRVRDGGEPSDDGPILAEIFEAAGWGPAPPAEQLGDLLGTEVRWKGRLDGRSAPTDRTVGFQVARYLDGERARVDAEDLSASEFDTIRRCLHMFRDWLGGSTAVEEITASRWRDWYLSLVALTKSAEYKKKLLRIARTFLVHLAEMGLYAIPPNLLSRRYRFGGGPKEVPILETGGVRKLIDEAPGQLKLHLCLMANCGMTQADISDLHPSEVDWEKGRIKRKRSKTSDEASVPTVEYPLWSLTLELLRRYGRRDGDRVLLTESGRPWVRDWIDPNGKRHKTDAIKSNYIHLAKRLEIDTPMKLLRKTSASLLENHDLFCRSVPLFLGHAPSTVAERSYAESSQDRLDRGVRWLGDQYGFGV